ncbi:PSRP1 [Scenedesmus sp. PABB004]|nr:PSRP1 [Scenedesmus sp. PABB004]
MASRFAIAAPARPAPVAAARLARPAIQVRPPRVARGVTVAAAAAAQAVKITIQGRRLPVTDAIKTYVEEKISKSVANYAHAIKKVDVTLSARGGDTGTHGAKQQKVDVTITTLRAGVVRVEDAEESLYASIDVVCDKVSRKLRKVKERLMAQGTWPGRGGPRLNTEEEEFKEYMDALIVETLVMPPDDAPADGPGAKAMPPAVMRTKVISCDPAMSAGDAIEALEAVGHDFYVFKNSGAGNQIQIVYKRESGGYGVLVPHARAGSAVAMAPGLTYEALEALEEVPPVMDQGRPRSRLLERVVSMEQVQRCPREAGEARSVQQLAGVADKLRHALRSSSTLADDGAVGQKRI